MFSGIVEALGSVVEVRPEPPGCRLMIREPKIVAETSVADSISVNGCCLTVVEVENDTMGFQAGPETLSRTNLGDLVAGSPVNLERSLKVGDRLGGHFVSGASRILATCEVGLLAGSGVAIRRRFDPVLGMPVLMAATLACAECAP